MTPSSGHWVWAECLDLLAVREGILVWCWHLGHGAGRCSKVKALKCNLALLGVSAFVTGGDFHTHKGWF